VTLEIVRTALAGAGREVVTCASARELWSALERSRPDLIVLDVQLGDADGTELCRALRADPRWRGLPVLFLTATTAAAEVAELFAAGGDDYVRKPVRPAELVARVAGRLERSGRSWAGGDVDGVTGLLHRTVAEPQLQRLVALAVRLGQPLCVAVLGVDGFRDLDPGGRERGLSAAGRAAAATLQVGDVGAAWTGAAGELVLGLLGCGAHDAEALMQRALAAAREPAAELTASGGIAEHPRDGAELAALVAAASAARRVAEAAGGGRVAIAGAPEGGIERVDVALVEDDEILARLVLDGLRNRGYEARWIGDGDEAARLLGGERPLLRADLVLLDWDLPARDGPTVLRGLAADGVLAGSRVVMLTARASQREILTTLELGAIEHVAKPFSLAVLMQRVERVLGR
jgi:DNA-binding response OmpR family regulator